MFNSFLGLLVFLIQSIYSISFIDIQGNTNLFQMYQGKKILLVNIATGSNKIAQLGQLEQLYQQHKDSVIVIGFPSNSFGKELKSNEDILAFCQNNYGITFPLAGKGSVVGTDLLPIYAWIRNFNDNGVLEGVVVDDFQKFLIDKNGLITGIYSSSVLPTDSIIQKAILEIE